MSTFGRVAIFLLVLVELSACAARRVVPAITEAERERLGVVGVTGVEGTAEHKIDLGPRGRLAGAAVGAAQGATWVGVPMRQGCAGEGCIVVAAVAAGALVGGLLIGGVVGAVQAVPVETAEQIETELGPLLEEARQEQDHFRAEIVSAAGRAGVPNVVEAGADGRSADTLLEVGLQQVSLVGNGGSDPDLAVHLIASARLVDREGVALYENDSVESFSDEHPFREWKGEDGRLLREEIARARAALALSIVEDVWLGRPKRAAEASPSEPASR